MENKTKEDWFIDFEVEPGNTFANESITDLLSEGGLKTLESLGRMKYIDPEGRERGLYKINDKQRIVIEKAITDGKIKAKIVPKSEAESLVKQ